jgi:hypothetical protein
MKKNQYTVEQIDNVLKQAVLSTVITDINRAGMANGYLTTGE